jgi:hypothetical protein
MRAADDFAAIRARMEALQRERELAAIRKDPDAFIQRVRSIRLEEIEKLVQERLVQERTWAAAQGFASPGRRLPPDE